VRQLVPAIDIEKAFSEAIGVSATPVPANLGETLPYTCVFTTGGTRSDIICDMHSMDLDTWDETWAKAMARACELVGLLTGLEGSTVNGVSYARVLITGLPYANPDPDRPDLARVTFSAQVITHAPVISVD